VAFAPPVAAGAARYAAAVEESRVAFAPAAGAPLYAGAELPFRVEPEVAVERAARSSVVQRASRSGLGSPGWAE
jgi:hypothetical protein